MSSLSASHWCMIVAVVMLLFGGQGRISDLMGNIGKGLRSLKRGLAGEDRDD